MNKAKIISELQNKYSGKNIVENFDNDSSEIVCEVDSKKGIAVAVIDKTILHYHKKIREVYKIIRGELKLLVDGKEFILKEGDEKIVNPGEKHCAIGNETWIEVIASPPWSPQDHILLKNE